jgi:HSP20 family molecular chaperone IbpA
MSRVVVAKREDGVLKLTLPKREGGNSKTIQIE